MMNSGWVIQAILYVNFFIIGVLITLAIQHFRAHRSQKNQSVNIEMLPEKVREEVVESARKHYQQAVYKSAVQLDKNLAATTERLNKSLDTLRDNVTKDEKQQYDEALNAIRTQAASIVGATAQEIATHQKELRKHFEDHQAQLDQELQKEANATEAELQKYRQDYQKRQAQLEAQLLEHQKQLEEALAKREQSLTASETQLEGKMLELQKIYAEKQQQMEAKMQADIETRRQQLAGKIEAELADILLAFLTDALGTDVDLGAQTASLTRLLEEHKDELLKGVK